MARRQFILATYDIHPTGVVEDNIDGGAIVADNWFKIAHPMPLRFVLDAIAWIPESLGANRENHLCRTSAVVPYIVYAPGRIIYETTAIHQVQTDVLRLAFKPTRITVDDQPLAESSSAGAAGCQLKPLANGDYIVTIHHQGKRITVEGDDPQQVIDDDQLAYKGDWRTENHAAHFNQTAHVASSEAELSFTFEGNQVRIIGAVDPAGGQADVWLDDVKQLCGIDCWNPHTIRQQLLWYTNGLATGKHTIRIAVTGRKNPRATGTNVTIDAIQFSNADGDAIFGSGGGPTDRQAWILGYPHREPYVDKAGQPWLSGTETIVRLANRVDPVVQTWYAHPKRLHISGTNEPELYRYGMHSNEITAYVTTGPGQYRLRLLLMERRQTDLQKRLMDVAVNGQLKLKNLDIVETALTGRPVTVPDPKGKGGLNKSGLHRAAEVVFDRVEPVNGVIAVRVTGVNDAEALLSAIEVTPQPASKTKAQQR